jgi:hypothetical protein
MNVDALLKKILVDTLSKTTADAVDNVDGDSVSTCGEIKP